MQFYKTKQDSVLPVLAALITLTCMFCINEVVIAYCCGGIDCIKRTIQVL